MLLGVRDDVRAGHKLSAALAARPRDFPEIYRALIGAGEESGDLAQVMEKLADYIEERNAARQGDDGLHLSRRGGLRVGDHRGVPAGLCGAAGGVGFSHAKQQLPMLTRVMLALSDYVREWGWSGASRLAVMLPAARTAWHARVLRLPLVGRFVLGVNAARFASTLSILCGSGVALLTSLEAARRKNDVLRAVEGSARVREGARYRPRWARRRYSQLRAPDRAQPVARAAGPGAARGMAMTALLEPALILVMGGFVLLIVLAVMMPILEMNQLIR